MFAGGFVRSRTSPKLQEQGWNKTVVALALRAAVAGPISSQTSALGSAKLRHH